MNTGTTVGTAFLRSFWVFLGAFFMAAIPAYWGVGQIVDIPLSVAGVSQTERIMYAISAGILAGFGGGPVVRGLFEGTYDGARDSNVRAGNEAPKPSDVGQPMPPATVVAAVTVPTPQEPTP